jgi:hypothetical protein
VSWGVGFGFSSETGGKCRIPRCLRCARTQLSVDFDMDPDARFAVGFGITYEAACCDATVSNCNDVLSCGSWDRVQSANQQDPVRCKSKKPLPFLAVRSRSALLEFRERR